MNQKRAKRIRFLGKILFLLYMIFLLYFLIFSDWYGRTGIMEDYRYNLELFKEIKRFMEYREVLGYFAVFTNLVGNVLIFIPYGFFVSMASESYRMFRTLFYSLGLSFCVEVFQFITRVGAFDVDDLFLNTVGGLLGWLIFLICNRRRRRRNELQQRR